MIDMYNEAPTMYWYETKHNTEGQYVLSWRLGRQFAGFLKEPEYHTIDRYKLKFVGVGDITYIEELRI